VSWLEGLRAWAAGFALDLKLGGRMLVKYPGLTIVGGLAMAFAICVGTVVFAVLTLFVHPTLPLPAGDRIVQIRTWDVAANRPEPRALHDFVVWRGALRSVTELGASRDVTRTLISAGGDARPVQVAEITASGFRIAEGTPLLGRVLVAADERPEAPPVAVLGYEVWRTRFGSDPDVLGRTVQLGSEHATVPRTTHPDPRIELDNDTTAPVQSAGEPSANSRLPLREVNVAAIDPSYFDVLEAPMLAGRAFHAGDLAPGARVAIVDQGFVDQVLQGQNPIGQRVRFVDDGDDAGGRSAAPWYEVVGVVRELGMGAPTEKGRAAGFYLPATPDRLDRVYMLVHVRGDPMTLGPPLREIAAAVDPTLRLSELQRMDEVTNDVAWVVGLWLRVTILMTAVALLLSLAGIYAVLVHRGAADA
jgi:hypothetical protein